MKHLLLVRHGRAEAQAREAEDFERRLVRKGREESARMAKRARRHGPKPDHAVSSPAERALETARLFRRGLGAPRLQIHLEDDLYREASAASLLRTVRAFPAARASAVVVGHNPSLTDFLRFLAPDFGPVFPKSGAVWLSTEAPDWKELDRASCRVEWFDFLVSPGRLKKARKGLESEIADRLAAAVDGVLRGLDAGAADGASGAVSEASHRIARRFLARADGAGISLLRSALPAERRRSGPG